MWGAINPASHPDLEKLMNFRNICKSVVTVFVVALMFTVTSFTTPTRALEPAQKAEIEALIRSYILENPEILLEAQDALDKKRKLAAALKVQTTIKEQRDLIFSSKNQFEIGNPDADVTIVEFYDYNCPFCKRAMADMDRLLKEDKNLKFVLKELPILSEGSVTAHRISTAVGRLYPEKYDQFHRALLGANGQKNGKRALQLADKMGLDIRKVLDASKEESVNDAFREVNTLATDLGMNGTPSYVIGNEVLFGALGYNVLKAKVDNLRKCGDTVSC